MISLTNVWFEYPQSGFALDIPTLEVAAGQRVAAIGPSRSRKTTLLNLISGIDRRQAGEITTAGERVDQLSAPERRAFRITTIGFVFQDFLQLDYLDVLDNMLYPYRTPHGTSPR